MQVLLPADPAEILGMVPRHWRKAGWLLSQLSPPHGEMQIAAQLQMVLWTPPQQCHYISMVPGSFHILLQVSIAPLPAPSREMQIGTSVAAV